MRDGETATRRENVLCGEIGEEKKTKRRKKLDFIHFVAQTHMAKPYYKKKTICTH